MKSKHEKLLPSLVIGIGDLGNKIVYEASRIYLTPDPDRKFVTKFTCLGKVENGASLNLLQVPPEIAERPIEINFPNSSSAGKRQELIERLVKSSEKIRTTMNSIFHEIRSHVNLMQIDMDQKSIKPVNLFIVADLVDPMAAAALLPLAFLLEDISKRNPNTHGHLLLNVAIIPENNHSKEREKAGLYKSLQNLDLAFTDIRTDPIKNLLSAMGIREKSPLISPAYLFDYRKPGFNDVRDDLELKVIMTNSLIALMSGDLADINSRNRPMGYVQGKKAFYQSIGTACLSFDPDTLIQACATRFTKELLREGFLRTSNNSKGMAEILEQSLHRLGELSEWYAKLLAGSTYTTAVENSIPIVANSHPALTFDPIDFENVRDTPWLSSIKNFEDNFESDTLLGLQQQIQKKAEIESKYRLDKIIDLLTEQIQNPGIYPQGTTMLIDLIESLTETINEYLEQADERKKQIQKCITEEKSNNYLELIQKCFNGAPALPLFWNFIPKIFRKPAGVILNVEWIFKNYIKLESLKKQVLSSLAVEHASRVEDIVLEKLIHSLTSIKLNLLKLKKEINDFDEVLIHAEEKIADDWNQLEFPLINSKYTWHDTFRCPVVNKTFAEKVYTDYQHPIESIVATLLTNIRIFEDWNNLTPQDVQESIYLVAADLYEPIRSIHIHKILELQNKHLQESSVEPSGVTFDPISPLMRAALPLMRPNFDALGGSEYSTIKRFIQAENKNLPLIQSLLEAEEYLSFCQTDDPYSIAAVTIRDLMPLDAFSELYGELRESFNKLSAQQKKRLENVFVPYPSMEGEDLVEKQFFWRYGSPEEQLEITLPISQNRYKHARQENRLPQSKWIDYVLDESPEMNYLSACFLNIFLQHPNWNTYEQTSAILAFVQQVIKYAFDKDTTPEEEWPRYPIETLQEEVGDCEDVAILTAAIMNRLGFQVALLILPGHCALGIAGVENMPGDCIKDSKSGRHYYYAEATGNGWQIGSLPDDYRHKEVQILSGDRLITSK